MVSWVEMVNRANYWLEWSVQKNWLIGQTTGSKGRPLVLNDYWLDGRMDRWIAGQIDQLVDGVLVRKTTDQMA